MTVNELITFLRAAVEFNEDYGEYTVTVALMDQAPRKISSTISIIGWMNYNGQDINNVIVLDPYGRRM